MRLSARNPSRIVFERGDRLLMAKLLGHIEQGDPRRQEQAGIGVAKVVDTEARQSPPP